MYLGHTAAVSWYAIHSIRQHLSMKLNCYKQQQYTAGEIMPEDPKVAQGTDSLADDRHIKPTANENI